MGEWINKLWYMYIRILFSHKKKEVFPFVTTWMHFKGIMQSEISQRETSMISLMCGISNKQTKNPEAHRHGEQIGDCWRER